MSWLEDQNRREWDQSWRERWDDCVRKSRARWRRMFRGDTLIFGVQVLKPVPGVPGDNPPLVPMDITGYAMWMTAKYFLADPDQQSVVQLTNATTAIYFPSPTAGMGVITMPPRATLFFPDQDVRIIYDVQIASPTGVVSTVEVGFIDVEPDVTRATVIPVAPTPQFTIVSIPVASGSTGPYQVLAGDGVVEFDTRDGLQARAILPSAPTVGEKHTFAWLYWVSSSPPILIDAGAGMLIQPYSQTVQSSGVFAQTTNITDFGARITYQFDGAKWIIVA